MNSALNAIRHSFSPLSIPNFRTYFFGQGISLIGTWLQSTALAWVMWQLTGSESALSMINILNTLPLLVITPYASVFADRFDRRKILIYSQVGLMAVAFITAFLVQTSLVQPWHLYVLALITGIITALDLTAQQAFLGDLAGMAEVRRAINLNGVLIQGSRIIGPSVAGFVVQNLGAALAFWMNGLSFIVVIISLFMVRAMQKQKTSTDAKPLQQIKEGFAFVLTQPRIVDMFIFVMLMFMFSWTIVFNLMPSVADKVLGGDAQTLGYLLASSGAGALFSLLFVVPIAQTFSSVGRMLGASMVWAGAWIVVFSLSTSLPLSMLALFLSFMGNPIVYTNAMGLSQLMSPSDMRGRMVGVFMMVGIGTQPIAALLAGILAERIGVSTVILIYGALLMGSAIAMMVFRNGLWNWVVKYKNDGQSTLEIEAVKSSAEV
jgi:MFS family permease